MKKMTDKQSSTNGEQPLREAYQDGRCVFCGGHECDTKNPCKWRKQAFGKNGQFSEDSLNMALRHVQDLLEKITVPYMLLGDVVEGITKRDSLVGSKKIEVGIEEKYLIPEILSSLKTEIGNIETPYGFGYLFDKIPVEIKIIKRKYKFFKYPDLIMYRLQEYRIPNPVNDYLKARWIVR